MKLRLLAAASCGLVLFGGDVSSEGKRWWSHILYLADDKLEGRNTGSEGYRKAAIYVAAEYERAGLKPAGPSGSFQPGKFKSRDIIADRPTLTLVLIPPPQPPPLA